MTNHHFKAGLPKNADSHVQVQAIVDLVKAHSERFALNGAKTPKLPAGHRPFFDPDEMSQRRAWAKQLKGDAQKSVVQHLDKAKTLGATRRVAQAPHTTAFESLQSRLSALRRGDKTHPADCLAVPDWPFAALQTVAHLTRGRPWGWQNRVRANCREIAQRAVCKSRCRLAKRVVQSRRTGHELRVRQARPCLGFAATPVHVAVAYSRRD